MRILYVEDNPELRDTIALLMEAPGRSIVSCASAEEALARDAEQGPFDLVMTDVSLPGMNGPAMCRALLARHGQQRFVLCSGYHLDDELAGCGAQVQLLHKPFDIEALEALLDDAQARLQDTAS
ncbi:response regulator [Pulveribacter suum]|uniref:Response regulator n=1 Tax=Pulveribacter suum TaxID=2116657 RepID=A0A2P1NP02_9BURK|nr:response regulator [Pulveribacter suum]AVP58781.1 response regulator [Pulveribacter suum]